MAGDVPVVAMPVAIGFPYVLVVCSEKHYIKIMEPSYTKQIRGTSIYVVMCHIYIYI